MNKIRTAVIGVGHLGRFHAEKHAALEQCDLRAVVDVRADAAQAVAQSCGTRALTDFREILGEVDAVSIAVPAVAHYDVARTCLEAGVDVLLEKPMTVNLEQAHKLIDLARARERILQIGHLERFNPAALKLEEVVHEPLFIECIRIAPVKPRATDVDVLLDLMIHDIDLALSLVGREVESVEAHGAPVLTDGIDIANARIRFEGGCVGNFTASRISMKSERKMRFFQRDTYVSADFQDRQVSVLRRVRKPDGALQIVPEHYQSENGDALLAEIESFVQCVATRQAPKVTGLDGCRALATALQIHSALQKSAAAAATA
jgi:predicted dehydrogenase